jgi:hypothetical protein
MSVGKLAFQPHHPISSAVTLEEISPAVEMERNSCTKKSMYRQIAIEPSKGDKERQNVAKR